MNPATRFRFTTRAIEQLRPASGDVKAIEYTDTEIPGFKLAVTKTGRKTFSLRYTFRDQKRAARIGEFPATSLAQARSIALEMRGLLDRGIDPQENRDREKGSPTLAAFAEEYLTYAKQHLRSWKATEGRLRLHIVPRFGRKRLCDLTRREIELYIASVRQSHTPATANRFLCVISSLYRQAIAWEQADSNPCAGIPRAKENNQRQRFLSPDEIGRLLVALDNAPNPIAAASLKFLLLSGLRRQEALSMRWEHVDFERRVAFIPHTKTGRSRYLQLNQAACEILERLDTRDKSPWVFASTRDPAKPIDDPRKTFWRALKAAGIEDHIRIHDLRHTFASIAVNSGQSLYAVQGLLSHSSPQMTQRYAHLASSSLREASQAVADVVVRARAAAATTDEAQRSTQTSA